MISPDKWDFDNSRAIHSKNWGLITVPDSFMMDFSTWVWTTKSPLEVKIIRENKNYWSLIFETDVDWKDLTKSVIEKMEWIEDAEVVSSEPVNPYKMLPEVVLSKMSIPELKDACKSIWEDTAEDASKKDLIAQLLK